MSAFESLVCEGLICARAFVRLPSTLLPNPRAPASLALDHGLGQPGYVGTTVAYQSLVACTTLVNVGVQSLSCSVNSAGIPVSFAELFHISMYCTVQCERQLGKAGHFPG